MSPEVLGIGGDQLVEELRHGLAEAREQQAATAEILRIISSSPTDLQRVFSEIAASAARLCDAVDATIYQVDGGDLRLVAHHGSIPQSDRFQLVRGLVNGRAILDRRTIHVADLQAETDEYPEGSDHARHVGHRTNLAVPIIRAGKAIGAISIRRTEVRPFTDQQIDLLQTFADQAVIAIENTRLFEEVQARTRDLEDSLEHATATSEVLKVISTSAFDLRPVLESLIENAVRLCGADKGIIYRQDGDVYRAVVSYGHAPEWQTVIERYPIAQDQTSATGRAVIDRQVVHIHDTLADPDYRWAESHHGEQGMHRTILAVPMLREGIVIGVIVVRRTWVEPFTDRQIGLITTFADQAVIAIENTRLFEEVQARTRELAKTVEDLEIASQHKNQFVANMSHELRTPLAAILGYAELIQEGFYEPQGPKSLDALTRIRSNGKHLLGLINTVLDIAKIESGQFTLNMTEYAIESVVETVRAATESLAQNKKLTLTTSVDRSLPVGLGDEQRLTQVLLNLVGNAIKFTDAGEVRIAAGARNGYFAVSVTDTGPGITPDQQDRIFDQFHQVDSSLTKAKGGTGLGLAIAKQIVEMHGGRIWVESTLGKGSTFQMELPTRAEFRKLVP
jgi:signal transduction histidine kinase/putative methionine-R-sulfoxide reductase with GAF domain